MEHSRVPRAALTNSRSFYLTSDGSGKSDTSYCAQDLCNEDSDSEGSEDSRDGGSEYGDSADEDSLVNPMYRRDLKSLLSKDWNLSNVFASEKHCYHATNPILVIRDVGVVGLPLSVRDVNAVKGAAVRSNSGEAESHWQGVWEIDASTISFENPAWSQYLKESVQHACRSLGIRGTTGRIRVALRKLLLLSSDSWVAPHMVIPATGGHFATVHIMLPSRSSGGLIRIKHGGECKEYACGTRDMSRTTTLAWYTGVMFEMDRVTDGHRMVLQYHLIDRTSSIPPAISHEVLFTEKIHSLLVPWKADSAVPEKLVYLLHPQTQDHNGLCGLQLHDARLASLLDTAVGQLGFCIGIATVVFKITGRGFPDCQDVHDDVTRQWKEILSRKTTIHDVTTLDGTAISSQLEFIKGDETIPWDLCKGIEREECKSTSWSLNVRARCERRYERAALIIWHPTTEVARLFGPHSLLATCKSLSKITLDTPKEDAHDALITDAISRCSDNPTAMVDAVCHVAFVWNDMSLWDRAITAAAEVAGISVFADLDKLCTAISKFGLEHVQTKLQIGLKHERGAVAKLQLLVELDQRASSSCPADIAAAVSSWAKVQAKDIIGSPETMSSSEQPTTLLLLVLKFGMQNLFIHQAISLADSQYLIELTKVILATPTLEDAYDVYTLAAAALRTSAVCAPPISQTWLLNDVSPQGSLENAKLFLRCLRKTPELCSTVLHKMTAVSAYGLSQLHAYALRAVIPLLSHVGETFDGNLLSHPPIVPAIRALFDISLQNPPYIFPPVLGFDNEVEIYVTALLRVAYKNGFWDAFQSSFDRNAERLSANPSVLQTFLIKLMPAGAQADGPNSQTHFLAIVPKLLMTYIGCQEVREDAGRIALVIDRCLLLSRFGVEDRGALHHVLAEVLPSTDPSDDYLHNTLLPLLPELTVLAAKHNSYDTFAPIFQTTLLAWIKLLNRLPPHRSRLEDLRLIDLSNWSCSCDDCQRLLMLLKGFVSGKTTLRRLTASKLAHIRALCKKHLPQGVQYVDQADFIEFSISNDGYTLLVWKAKFAKRDQALTILKQEDAVIRRVLGPHYDTIMAGLKGPVAEPSCQNEAGNSLQYGTRSRPRPGLPPSTLASVPAPISASTSTSILAPASASSALEAGEIRDEDDSGPRPVKRQKVAQ
ncbi:hypothetical protein EIP91_000338 [Steccherinum ochraceum]|uniref:Uncharacterized protein n=1 Tax=Steccherinum ochraceum TaxID=92696 RepID=A0A4R0RG92_9APHY|nr:hypothetical protein EIP91_000338 [Steccherinum ochraceum]